MKKTFTTIQKYWLYLRLLRWAVVHSPNFHECELYLANPPVLVDFWWSGWGHEPLIVRLKFYRLRILFHVPWRISEAFIKARKREGEIIYDSDVTLDKDIPF